MTSKVKMLVLSLTGKCNFNCRYCYASEHERICMSREIALAALKLAPRDERFVLQFSGGEPLLNFKTLQAVVEQVERDNLPAVMQIQTNGSLLTDEMALFLYKHRVAIGVSLDGRPNVNDKLRLKKNGHGATGATLKGIEILRRNNIACGITCVVTAENVHELSGIVDFAYFLGNIRKIGFDILRGQGRGQNLKPPTAKDMEAAMQLVYARRDTLTRLTGVYIEIAQQERVKTLCQGNCHAFGHCYAMNGEAAFVTANGNIYACSSLIGNQDFYLGNVINGLEQELVDKTKLFISESMDFCRHCPDFKLCGGGCFARWYGMENKDDYGAECAMKRVSIKQVKRE